MWLVVRPYAMIENGKETIIGDVVFVDSENDVALVSIQGMATRKPLRWRVCAQQQNRFRSILQWIPEWLHPAKLSQEKWRDMIEK